MTASMKRFVSTVCALALAVSLVPLSALAYAEEARQDHSTGKAAAADSALDTFEPISETIDLETSARALNELTLLSSTTETSVAPLKKTNEVEWIDRIDMTAWPQTRDFYNALVEATDGDGVNDYLMEDTYFKGTHNSSSTFAVGSYVKGLSATEYHPTIVAAVKEDLTTSEANELQYDILPYLYAAYAAFDRDRPEVFWLSGSCQVSSWMYNVDSKTGKGTLCIGFLLDVMVSDSYSTTEKIKEAKSTMESNISTILGGVSSSASTYQQVSYFNRWLVENNEYNSVVAAIGRSRYEDAWKAVSALNGNTDLTGPVCEGYARAFKVLCDRRDIPCVLVDGYAGISSATEAHMWNNVKVEQGWYAVDVTWNDSTADEGGDEQWLLVGSDTIIRGKAFDKSHPVSNIALEGCPAFTNGPELSKERYQYSFSPDANYTPRADFGSKISSVALPSTASAQDAEGNIVKGSWSWANPSQTFNQAGSVYVEAIFTPSDSAAYKASSVYIPVNVAAPLQSMSLSKTSFVYTGSTLRPAVTVKGAGSKLANGTDYSITWPSSSKNVGTYTVKVTGKNNFTGTKRSTYTIIPKGTSVKSLTRGTKAFTVKWTKKAAAQTTGYQIRYSTKKSMNGAKTVKVKGASKTSCKISGLKAKKTYYVQIRVYKTTGGKTYCSSWSSTKSVKTK